jgi:hypothetical protein
MAKANREAMKEAEIKLQLQTVCDLLDIRFNAFFNNDGIPPNIKGSAVRANQPC